MNEFKASLKLAIEKYIREQRKDGTVGMSLACLKQCVRPPHGGPTGTNAAWVYDQMFREAVKTSRIASAFTSGF